jgi:hypothetical protein
MALIALENMQTGAVEMKSQLAEVVAKLGGKGASRRAAEHALMVAGLRPISSEVPVLKV